MLDYFLNKKILCANAEFPHIFISYMMADVLLSLL